MFFCHQVVSLSVYIYTWCRIGSFILQNGAKLMAKTMQVCWPACAWPVHCVPCCVCLVKSASVESFVFFCHQVVSLSVYIYMLGAGSVLHPAEWCKVDGKDPGLHVLCQVLHSRPCCVYLLGQECICTHLLSSVIKWSLSLYIYIYIYMLAAGLVSPLMVQS